MQREEELGVIFSVISILLSFFTLVESIRFLHKAKSYKEVFFNTLLFDCINLALIVAVIVMDSLASIDILNGTLLVIVLVTFSLQTLGKFILFKIRKV